MTGIEQGKLKVTVLAPMALVLCILLSVSVLTTYRLQHQEVANDVESRIKGTKTAFRQELDEDAEQMGIILDFLLPIYDNSETKERTTETDDG